MLAYSIGISAPLPMPCRVGQNRIPKIRTLTSQCINCPFLVTIRRVHFTERGRKMTETTYGYVRVSTQEQNEERQLLAMRAFGVEEENIVIEKLSGKDFKRPRYQRLIKALHPGDVLVVKSIDRLGRNYDEILEQWGVITKQRKAAIVVLDMPLLDTRQGRDLTGTLIADIVLQLLSYVAQTERENIRQRQAEGIAAAKASGVHFGPLPKVLPGNFEEYRQAWRDGVITLRAAAEACGMPKSTFRDASLRAEQAMSRARAK